MIAMIAATTRNKTRTAPCVLNVSSFPLNTPLRNIDAVIADVPAKFHSALICPDMACC